ncbi:MAG TPA: hypothetical protein VH301_15195 [Usitatibacter sp.]|nr:hypothetical protein [Usitatibacter sp.]
MTRRFRAAAAAATILALLFTQLALAALPCAMNDTVGMEQGMAGCDRMDSQSMPLCRHHCAQAAQSLDKPELATLAPAPLFGLAPHISLRPLAACVHAHAPLGHARGTHPPSPPPNCCLRI